MQPQCERPAAARVPAELDHHHERVCLQVTQTYRGKSRSKRNVMRDREYIDLKHVSSFLLLNMEVSIPIRIYMGFPTTLISATN